MDTGGTAAPDLGGLVLQSSGETSGSATPATGGSASEAVVRTRRQRSDAGKPRGSGGAGTGTSVQAVPAISQQQFAQLYSPALWEKAVCAPADAMCAISGNKVWEVSPREREAVGASCSVAAQCFAVTDPRWLAASLAIVTVLDIYGVRLGLYIAEKKAQADKEKAEKQRKQQQAT